MTPSNNYKLDELDRRIIAATQEGLPLAQEPYREVGEKAGASASEVRLRLLKMLEHGIIRRIGAVPNHYALGMTANGMSVWNVDDSRAIELGEQIGALDFVSHCYLRPRYLPVWPYNLFAMVHGRKHTEVLDKVNHIAGMLASAVDQHDVLFSTRILKKTGLRIAA